MRIHHHESVPNLSPVLRTVLKASGYGGKGVAVHIRPKRRYANKLTVNGLAWCTSRKIELFVPRKSLVAEVAAVFQHELDHVEGRLDHKDMTCVDNLVERWKHVYGEKQCQ